MNRMTRVTLTLTLTGISIFATAAWAQTQPLKPASIDGRVFQPAPDSERQRELAATYYASLVDWGRIVSAHVQPVPDRQGQSYIGLPGNLENDVRPTAYAAMVLSFLAEVEQRESPLTPEERSVMREQSLGLLRYLTVSHVSGGGTCVNGKPWGNGWQSAMWARAVGMAAWQSWNSLDDTLRVAVTNMIVTEADRFIELQPKSSVHNDTGAEENAWNASITALACNMFRDHPRASSWENAAQRFMYNTFSVAADAQDETPGDDGQPIRSWVTTINVHDDFTLENHGLIHVGYLKNSLTMLLENAVHWRLVDRTPPAAAQHHVPEVFRLLCRGMNWNGAAIYFGGNDWQIYETQCSDILAYAALRQLAADQEAAYLEDVALQHLRLRQQAEGGYYNGRRDLEYGGLCATRLIMCYALHATSDSLTPPTTREQFDASANGVTRLDAAKAILHRTADKFASFTWAQKRMGLTIPSSDSSVVWPHFTSYTGVINAEHSSEQFCQLRNLTVNSTDEGFSVSGTLVRCQGTLLQDFYFASPAGAFTIYVERLRPQAGFQLEYRKTGIIGLDYAVGENQRQLYGEFGEQTAVGTGDSKQTIPLTSRWLNIDNRIGYVVCRTDGRQNTILYHNKDRFVSRRPHLQESLALISDEQQGLNTDNNWACVVTFLNQSAEQTQAMTQQVQLKSDGDTATVSVAGQDFRVTFERD